MNKLALRTCFYVKHGSVSISSSGNGIGIESSKARVIKCHCRQ